MYVRAERKGTEETPGMVVHLGPFTSVQVDPPSTYSKDASIHTIINGRREQVCASHHDEKDRALYWIVTGISRLAKVEEDGTGKWENLFDSVTIVDRP